MKIHLVAGTRPNFVKIAPLYHALIIDPCFSVSIIHTGQHYDNDMYDYFFDELRLPNPDVNFDIKNCDNAEQISRIITEYNEYLEIHHADLIIVVGDCNASVGGALTAKLNHIPVAHLEAGLRSKNYKMPEENNRIATDALCDVLWTTEEDAELNIIAEGIGNYKISFVGNIMLDTIELMRDRWESKEPDDEYALVTLHRPSNVNDIGRFADIIDALNKISNDIKIVFPLHPRTREVIDDYPFVISSNIHFIAPQKYTDNIALINGASFVITDSGGIQEETTYLNIPCFTMRDDTERPVTCTHGTNQLVTPETIIDAIKSPKHESRFIKGWDGETSQRIIRDIKERFNVC